MSTTQNGIRDRLRDAVRTAMRERDRAATATYRNALAAIDNAEAVPLHEEDRAGAIETAPVGVGSSEAARRELNETDQQSLVTREINELESIGRTEDADLLRKLITP